MSLEAWGDESPAATRGSETQLYEDFMRVRLAFHLWLKDAQKRKEFWSPEDEALAVAIDDKLGELRQELDAEL